jgi:hypothetical protein
MAGFGKVPTKTLIWENMQSHAALNMPKSRMGHSGVTILLQSKLFGVSPLESQI